MATTRERFMEKVDMDGPGGCWLWTGYTSGKGYGLWDGGESRRAHRQSYELHCGGIPTGLCVLHRCDVRLCVNPDHLFLGTRSDNNRDMVAKGRWQHGENHYRAKLTEEKVLEIRREHSLGVASVLLAERYGVTKSTIHAFMWLTIADAQDLSWSRKKSWRF